VSIYVAFLGAIVWLIASFGGMGALMYIGLILEVAFGRNAEWLTVPTWVLAGVLLTLWWGSVLVTLFHGRAFLRWIGRAHEEKRLSEGEWSSLTGHALVLCAAANAILFRRASEADFVYGFLILAAIAYASAVALELRACRASKGYGGAAPEIENAHP
jgi:hypothetical protein